MLWNFSLYSDHNHSSNHPNIVLLDYQQSIIYFMEISCPADVNVALKEEEKLLKHSDLAADFQQIYGIPVTILCLAA